MSFAADCDEIDRAMSALAASSAGLCTVQRLNHPTEKRARDVHYLEIKPPAAPATRPVALIIGGVHAHELAPPPAVLAFAKQIVSAYAAGDAVYPAFTDPDGNVPYASWDVKHDDVHRVVDAMTILIVPVVNPDGRDHVLHDHDLEWRGNLNDVACRRFGVDINRNFDIAWDSAAYYSVASERAVRAATATTCISNVYRGPHANSENETRNIAELIDSRDVRCFMDVHMYGRRIMRPWGIAENQSTDSSQSFTNRTLDRGSPPSPAHPGRSVLDGRYKEYLPDSRPDQLATTHFVLGEQMKHAILDRAGQNFTAMERSLYTTYQSILLYKEFFNMPTIIPVPGASDDYALSRQFKPGEPGPAYAFSMECGWKPDPIVVGDLVTEGGFVPTSVDKYRKIEREVHAALWAMLQGVVSTGTVPPPAGGPHGKKAGKKAGKAKSK